MRGYISAYDAERGALAWRFYTVPGDPAQPPENPILAEAAKTWSGEWWKIGGGGAVWESISYDPELNLIYFGVGNGTEWNQGYRSAGKGDNWFLSSIVAVNADSGDYVWHYQATPGEEWDFDAVQQLILADLPIEGVNRKVLMQANKNGFFYVLDRQTGKLISAQNFTPINWARGVDPNTGRPIENPDIRYDQTGRPASLLPGALGAHSWQAMAFNAKTGLVYIPAQEIGMTYESVKDFSVSFFLQKVESKADSGARRSENGGGAQRTDGRGRSTLGSRPDRLRRTGRAAVPERGGDHDHKRMLRLRKSHFA